MSSLSPHFVLTPNSMYESSRALTSASRSACAARERVGNGRGTWLGRAEGRVGAARLLGLLLERLVDFLALHLSA